MSPSELAIDLPFLAEWRGRPVAITGATGFVGFHLAQLLRVLGADVTAIVRPTSNTSRLQPLGVRCKISTLDDPRDLASCLEGNSIAFHAAGMVDFESDWDRMRQVNVQGTANFLKAGRRAGLSRIVVTSSIVTVGACLTPFVLNENSTWNLGSLRVPYVTTKRQAEEVALDASTSGCEVVVVNPSSVIGPQDYSESEFGALCNRIWRGRIPFHFGGGNNYVDVRDVAWGHVLAASRGRAGERYLLTGANLSSRQFFAILERTARKKIVRLCLPNALAPLTAWLYGRFRSNNGKRAYFTANQAKLFPYYFFYESTKARNELGWAPRPIERTLEETFHFWMQPRAERKKTKVLTPQVA